MKKRAGFLISFIIFLVLFIIGFYLGYKFNGSKASPPESLGQNSQKVAELENTISQQEGIISQIDNNITDLQNQLKQQTREENEICIKRLNDTYIKNLREGAIYLDDKIIVTFKNNISTSEAESFSLEYNMTLTIIPNYGNGNYPIFKISLGSDIIEQSCILEKDDRVIVAEPVRTGLA